MMILRLLVYGSRFPQILIDKDSVLTHSLLYKKLISDDLLWFYAIQITHRRFIDKVHELLLIINYLKGKYSVIIILKN